MKLISVQSRGDRIAFVYFDDCFWKKKKYLIWKKLIVKSVFGEVMTRSNSTSRAYSEPFALKAAEKWLKGAKQ